MFQHAPFAVLICALVAGVVGCEPAAVQSFGYAQVVPGPPLAPADRAGAPGCPPIPTDPPFIDLSHAIVCRCPPNPTEPPPARPAGPVVHVEARFIASAPRSLARHFALKPGRMSRTMPPEQARRAMEALQGYTCTRTLTLPGLTLFPGQKVQVTIDRRQAFMRDLGFAPDVDGDGTFAPVVDAASTGTTLTVAAEIEGGKVVLTHLEPVVSKLLGLRSCSAKVARAGRLCEVRWQEALLMEGVGPIDNPCRIALGPDEMLLVRLTYGLRQTVGSIRLYARGPVRERLEADPGGLAQPSEAELETVMLLQARIAPPAGQAGRPAGVNELP